MNLTRTLTLLHSALTPLYLWMHETARAILLQNGSMCSLLCLPLAGSMCGLLCLPLAGSMCGLLCLPLASASCLRSLWKVQLSVLLTPSWTYSRFGDHTSPQTCYRPRSVLLACFLADRHHSLQMLRFAAVHGSESALQSLRRPHIAPETLATLICSA